MRDRNVSLCLALVLVVSAAEMSAQGPTAQLAGRVLDPSGAAVVGAKVTVTNQDTNVATSTVTNDLGNYALASLPPGNYRVAVEAAGFRSVAQSGVVLQVAQVARLDFTLEVGAVTESVNVVGSAPLLDEQTSSLGQVIDSSKIINIPLNGRSPFRLVQLTTNVLTVPSTNGQFGDLPVNTMDDSIISINGGRAKTNEILIDGIPSTTGFVNQMTTIPSVDATEEFKVQSNNLSAEFGRFGGGVINVSTRAGSNQFHGTLFEFLRNDAFDANEFFNKRAGGAKPPFRMNQYGFAAGGPVLAPGIYNGRNRTFFFGDFQGARWRRGDVSVLSVPTAEQRAGNFNGALTARGEQILIYDPVTTRPDPARAGRFIRDPFPGNFVPQSRMDPVGRKLASYYPAPNAPGDPVTRLNNWVASASRGIDQANWSARLDHNLMQSWRTFGRFSSNRTTLAQPDLFGNPATSGVGANGRLRLYNYSGGWDNAVTLSPSSVLNLRSGFARFFWTRPTRSFGFDQTELGFPRSLVNQFSAPLFPIVSVEGFQGLGGGSVLRTGQDTYSLIGSLSKLAGRHNLKFGGDLRLRRMNLFNLNNGGGNYTFNRVMTRGPDPNVFTENSGSGFASLLLGTAASGTANIAAGISQQNWYYAGYIQDDIRLTAAFSLNLGLRYETESPITERRNQQNWFDLNLPSPVRNARFPDLRGGLVFAGAKGSSRYVYNWDRNNFAPRAGFAWKLWPQTVLRAGAGIFFAPLVTSGSDVGFGPSAGYSSTTPFVATLDGITPYRYLRDAFAEGLIQPTRNSLGAATFLGQSISVWDRSARTPYNVQWNADLQRVLPGAFLVDVAYAASRGVKLNFTRQLDALHPDYLALGQALQAPLVDNPFGSSIPTGPLAQRQVQLRQLLLPYPQYTGVEFINSPWGNSTYHSLVLKCEKRPTRGLGFLLSYTIGKLISDVRNSISSYDNSTNAGLNTGVQNWYDLRAERSLSELDVAQAVAFSYVVELPFGSGKRFLAGARGMGARLVGGWQISGVTTYRSGTPLQISAPIPGGGNRPNSAGRSARLEGSRPRSEKIDRWFDTTTFLLPAPYTNGNVSRTLPDVRGPALTNFDLSLVKNERLREAITLQFRAESFNLANTPHLWLPNTGLGNLQFGRINSTTGFPRVNQLALKLLF